MVSSNFSVQTEPLHLQIATALSTCVYQFQQLGAIHISDRMHSNLPAAPFPSDVSNQHIMRFLKYQPRRILLTGLWSWNVFGDFSIASSVEPSYRFPDADIVLHGYWYLVELDFLVCASRPLGPLYHGQRSLCSHISRSVSYTQFHQNMRSHGGSLLGSYRSLTVSDVEKTALQVSPDRLVFTKGTQAQDTV